MKNETKRALKRWRPTRTGARRVLVSVASLVFFACTSRSNSEPPVGDGGDAGLDGRDAADASTVELDAGALPVQWGACNTADWPSGYPVPRVATECASIVVPLDRADDARGSIALRVARQLARTDPGNRAVFVIEGGPGGSSVFTSGLIPDALPDLLEDFDVVYVDARGTGGSGYLGCSSPPRTRDDWILCANDNKSPDLVHYLSSDAADDIDAVRSALSYEEISILAVSYGTRIAFEYLRRHPTRVVATVLDGVAPPPADLFGDTIRQLERGIDRIVDDCERDPSCKAVSPRLREDLEDRRALLRNRPRPIRVGGTVAQETEQDFIAFLFEFLKNSWWRFRVPRAVHDIMAGDATNWNQMMTEVLGQTVSDSRGSAKAGIELDALLRARIADGFGTPFGSPIVNIVTMCAEIMPNSQGVDALNAVHAGLMWPTRVTIEKANACWAWEMRPLSAEDRTYVSTNANVLLVSADLDINVDPKWASAAMPFLPNGKSIIVPYATHLATYVPCVGRIETAYFRARGDGSAVDMGCLQELLAPGW